MDTVTQEAELHRQVIDDTINYLWNRSAFPGQSLDDVFPRTQVAESALAFKAKNETVKTSSYSGYYTGAAAATLAFSSIANADRSRPDWAGLDWVN